MFPFKKQLGKAIRKSPRPRPHPARLMVESLEDRVTPSVAVTFDYQALGAAANGFDAAAQQALNAAGHALGDHLSNPGAIAVHGGTMTYSDINQQTQTLALTGAGNKNIPANEVYVAVENSDLSSLRKRFPGAASWGSEGTFSGLPAGAVSHGGVIQVDLAYLKSIGVGPGTAGFQTLMEHELGHVLGFGESAAWTALTSDPSSSNPQFFKGPTAERVYAREIDPTVPSDGIPVPLDVKTPGHWAPAAPDGTNTNTLALPAAMQEINTIGFTPLDFAALQDIGWTWDGQGAVQPPGSLAVAKGAAAPAKLGGADASLPASGSLGHPGAVGVASSGSAELGHLARVLGLPAGGANRLPAGTLAGMLGTDGSERTGHNATGAPEGSNGPLQVVSPPIMSGEAVLAQWAAWGLHVHGGGHHHLGDAPNYAVTATFTDS
jgi:hypothetical protein